MVIYVRITQVIVDRQNDCSVDQFGCKLNKLRLHPQRNIVCKTTAKNVALETLSSSSKTNVKCFFNGKEITSSRKSRQPNYDSFKLQHCSSTTCSLSDSTLMKLECSLQIKMFVTQLCSRAHRHLSCHQPTDQTSGPQINLPAPRPQLSANYLNALGPLWSWTLTCGSVALLPGPSAWINRLFFFFVF